ncbi:MAG: hypothetical protein R3324_07140, partial [Halobacteriales archaeon]|nr:hypothetical protein [Halobacteriales archaeon]
MRTVSLAGQGDCAGFPAEIPVGGVLDPVGYTLQNTGDPNDPNAADLNGVTAFVEVTSQFMLSNFGTTQGQIVSSNEQGAQVEIGTLAPGEQATVTFRMEAIEAGQAILSLSGDHNEGTFQPINCDINVFFQPITITGVKWDDVNGNGQQDGEPGVGGVTIFADLNDDGFPNGNDPTATTSNNGSYELVIQPNEATTHVVIREVVPEGREQTFPGGDGVYEDELSHGSTVQNANFGNRAPQDFVEIDRYEQTTALVQLSGGGLNNAPFILNGPAEVHVFFDGPNEGDAEDDDNNGLDEVQTELVELNLTGGGVQLRLNPDQPSLGQIEELVNNNDGLLDLDPFADGDADSFFDVFFEVVLPDGTVLHNGQPLFISATIGEKPPFTRYIHLIPPGDPVELLTENDQPSGIFITRAEHNTGTIEVDAFEETKAEIDIITPGGGTETVDLRGPSTVHVYFEGQTEGDAQDDDGDNRDDVETEIVDLELRGISSLGEVIVRLNPNEPSLGEIEELVNNNDGLLDVDPFANGDADSFFDVFFEIEIGGQLLFNQDPKTMRAVITEKPPGIGDVYEDPEVIPLFTENGQNSGFALGTTRHIPRPEEEVVEIDRYEQTTALVQLAGGLFGAGSGV